MTLSPAEAMVLLDPEDNNGIAAAKVTFLALMAQGVLKQEDVRGRIGTITRVVQVRTPAEYPPHVAAILDAVNSSKTGTVADVSNVLSKATRGFSTYVPDLVRPRLIQRGLLVERRQQERRRVLFFFSRTVTISTWHLTEAGGREQARLRGMLDEAPAIRGMLDENPGRAAAMVAALGPLILLVAVLLPFLGLISSALAAQGYTGMSDSGSGDSEGGFEWLSSADSISQDLDSSFDSALSDAADSSSSDSSSSDSSSGSGSDRGGSDGGGGGGE